MNLPEPNEGGMNFDPEIIEDLEMRKYFESFLTHPDFNELLIATYYEIIHLIYLICVGSTDFDEFILGIKNLHINLLAPIFKNDLIDDNGNFIRSPQGLQAFDPSEWMSKVLLAQYYILLFEYNDLMSEKHLNNVNEAIDAVSFSIDNLREYWVQNQASSMISHLENLLRNNLN